MVCCDVLLNGPAEGSNKRDHTAGNQPTEDKVLFCFILKRQKQDTHTRLDGPYIPYYWIKTMPMRRMSKLKACLEKKEDF